MTSIVYMKSKKGDNVYVYVNEKTESGYRRKCIGHLDHVTGEIVPNKEKGDAPSVTTRSYGINMLLRRISDDIGLTESIQIIFKDSWDSIMSLAFYFLCEDSSIMRLGRWMEFNETPRMWPLTIDQVNSILRGVTHENIDSFFRVWNKRAGDHRYMVSSISTEHTVDKRSKNDFEKEFSTEVQVCFGRESGLPIAYRAHPTRYRTVPDMKASVEWMEWLEGKEPFFFITGDQTEEMDPGSIAEMEGQYLFELPPSDSLFGKLMGGFKIEGNTYDPQIRTGRRELFGKRADVHIYYDPKKAEREISRFLEVMDRCRFELENQHYVASHSSLYNKYFLFRGRGDVEFNSEAMMNHNRPAGYRILISNEISDPGDAFDLTDRIDFFRGMFERMRNDEDVTALKLYTGSNIASRMFIQFLATILGERLRRMLSDAGLDETLESTLFQMKCMMRVDQSNRKKPLMSEMNEHQREIMDRLIFSSN